MGENWESSAIIVDSPISRRLLTSVLYHIFHADLMCLCVLQILLSSQRIDFSMIASAPLSLTSLVLKLA